MNRIPAVAGSFYPADSTQLASMLDQYLKEAKSLTQVPKAIIVPHAGYQYSGPVAASAYAALTKACDTITRVILLGPSHKIIFRGLAVSRVNAFSTPLGDVPLDIELIEALVALPCVEYIEQAHAFEHSLEVHLPFLQKTLNAFKIVPLVTGDARPEQVASVLEYLWGGPETLIVVSSDLSHYHDYYTALALDQKTSQQIEQLDYEALAPESACGRIAIRGLLYYLRQNNLSIKTIDLRNSGDTGGHKGSVVGYGSYVVN